MGDRHLDVIRSILVKSAGRLLLLILLAVLFTACGPPNFLVRRDAMEAPPSGKALVRFISPKAVGYVFDGQEVIGFSFPKTHFDYVAEPGKHLFITSMENKAFMEADLLPGKTYYVLMRLIFGAWRSRIAFLPVNEGSELLNDANVYLRKSKSYDLDATTKTAWQNKYGPRMPALIDSYHNEIKDKYNWPRLNPGDWIK